MQSKLVDYAIVLYPAQNFSGDAVQSLHHYDRIIVLHFFYVWGLTSE